MRKFFPPPHPFFWHSPKKQIQRTTPEATTLWISFLHGRRSKMWRLLWRPWTPSTLWPGRSMTHSEKREHFFLIFCKKGAFHLPTFKFQGIFVRSQGTILLLVPPGIFGLLGVAAIQGCLRVGSGASVGCSPLRNKGFIAGLLKGNQWLDIRPQ